MWHERRRTMGVLFFFNDTATTEIYTLSLHDALPISVTPDEFIEDGDTVVTLGHTEASKGGKDAKLPFVHIWRFEGGKVKRAQIDRKSTRLNSSHAKYLVCRLLLEKKKIFFAPYTRHT